MDKNIKKLQSIEKYLTKNMYKKWKRYLPFNELITDRWERAERCGFGKGTSVYNNCYIFGKPKIGKNTWIGPFTILDASGGLNIGDNCSISAGVHMYTHDTVAWALTGGKVKNPEQKKVSIGNCCYIGPQTVIAKGVTIGDHVIIGACSFVNKNIPSYSIAFGAPAKIVGKIKIKNNKVKINYL